MEQEDIPAEQKEIMLSRKRRDSKDLPPELADSMNKLKAAAAEFIERFDRTEPEMRDIVKEFMKISEEVKAIQRGTYTARAAGGLMGGVGILAGLIAAPFTGGLSLFASGASLVAGGSAVIGSNLVKALRENEKVNEVEKWGKKFMELMEPLKEKLEEIKIISEEVEQQSSEVMAERALRDVEELNVLLIKCKELKNLSEGVLVLVARVLDGLRKIILMLFSITSTPTEDEKLRQTIIQTADQSQEVIDQFVKMRSSLDQFMERN